MGKVVQIEKQKRGLFGLAIAIAFWGFNALMLAGLMYACSYVADIDAENANAKGDPLAPGGTLDQAMTELEGVASTGVIVTVWLIGAAILGIMMAFSKGRKITIEK